MIYNSGYQKSNCRYHSILPKDSNSINETELVSSSQNSFELKLAAAKIYN